MTCMTSHTSYLVDGELLMEVTTDLHVKWVSSWSLLETTQTIRPLGQTVKEVVAGMQNEGPKIGNHNKKREKQSRKQDCLKPWSFSVHHNIRKQSWVAEVSPSLKIRRRKAQS